MGTLIESFFTKAANSASTNGCKALYFYGYSDSALSTTWTDSAIVISTADTVKPESFAGTLTTQTIALQTSAGFSKTLFIQGKNTGKQANYLKTKFVICGQETVVNNQAVDYENLNLQKYYVGGSVVSSTFSIDQATYATWFTTTEGSNSDGDCITNPTYSLC